MPAFVIFLGHVCVDVTYMCGFGVQWHVAQAKAKYQMFGYLHCTLKSLYLCHLQKTSFYLYCLIYTNALYIHYEILHNVWMCAYKYNQRLCSFLFFK